MRAWSVGVEMMKKKKDVLCNDILLYVIPYDTCHI